MKTDVRYVLQVKYICEICGTGFDRKEDAERCEKMPVEDRSFKKGDRVEAIEPRSCSGKDRNYIARGNVVEVLGPEPMDEDYSLRWLGGRLRGMHVFRYRIDYVCPYCREKRGHDYYSLELKSISRKRTKKH